MLGGARAQYHLRQMLVFLNMRPVNISEVIVTSSISKFDTNGKLIDDDTSKHLNELVRALIKWITRLKEIPLQQINRRIKSDSSLVRKYFIS
jgi:chromate reductase, NAD(P)H dehydrogenase (quinone)